MNHWKIAVLMLAVLGAGCANCGPVVSSLIDPGQAVLGAAAAPHTGVTGVFVMEVQAAFGAVRAAGATLSFAARKIGRSEPRDSCASNPG